MAMHDPAIGKRAATEILRAAAALDLPTSHYVDRIGLARPNFYAWSRGDTTPGGFQLAVMAEAGMDVIYILTGKRKAASDAGTSETAEGENNGLPPSYNITQQEENQA